MNRHFSFAGLTPIVTVSVVAVVFGPLYGVREWTQLSCLPGRAMSARRVSLVVPASCPSQLNTGVSEHFTLARPPTTTTPLIVGCVNVLFNFNLAYLLITLLLIIQAHGLIFLSDGDFARVSVKSIQGW